MTKVHLITDESIGEVKREFIEVERKAVVGDYVHITKFEGESVSEIRKVMGFSRTYSKDFFFTPGIRDESGYIGKRFNADNEEYITLDPTDIVHINGTRYRLAERKAEIGDKVLAIRYKADSTGIKPGIVCEVDFAEHEDGSVGVEGVGFFDIRINDKYLVLIPVDSAPAEPTPDIHDLLANLAQRVTSLERITGELVRAKLSLESQLRDTQNNVQTFAEQTESNTKDIAFLDERTYEKPGKPTKSAEEILREISKILERDERQ